MGKMGLSEPSKLLLLSWRRTQRKWRPLHLQVLPAVMTCALLVELSPGRKEEEVACPRCGSAVHVRKPAASTKTWALVITSLILFIPANTLPIMQVDFLGIPDRSTILDGIIYFFEEGSYGIGLIIFSASVLVPLFKIIWFDY